MLKKKKAKFGFLFYGLVFGAFFSALGGVLTTLMSPSLNYLYKINIWAHTAMMLITAAVFFLGLVFFYKLANKLIEEK